MNILATVCARAGSKGVKSKNIRELRGLPICRYTLAAYELFCERFGGEYGGLHLAINTDAPELFEQARAFGSEFLPVERRPELAGDTVSKVAVIRDTLARAELQTGLRFDAVLDMDLTSPLRRVCDIKNVIDAFAASPGAEVALTLTEARRNPWFNQLSLGSDGFYHAAIESDFVARQQVPTVYDANASLYVYSPEYLSGSDRIFLKAKLAASMMPDTAVLDIDSERDFELLSLLAGYFFDTDADYREVAELAKTGLSSRSR